MKILLVEDDFDKRESIKSCLLDELHVPVRIVECESVRSAIEKISVLDDIDLIVLDMSLPNFDISAEEPAGGTPESFGGREIMEHISLCGIRVPVIIVTQYSTFDEGKISLEELKGKCKEEYNEFYVGSIYYNSVVDNWKNELIRMVDSL